MSKKALLIIDMLNDFLEKDGALFCGEEARKIIPFVKSEIKKVREKNIPVIYICDKHTPFDSEFKMFPPHCVEGTKGSKIIKEIAPLKNELIIPKRRYSAFFQTDLDLTLRELKVTEIILVGVCTNICVLYTAADAVMLNYKVTILSKGVSSFDKSAHQFALKQMKEVLGVKVK